MHYSLPQQVRSTGRHNILTYGMGYHQQRYSPLKLINKQTIKRLVPVWNLSLDNNWGEQAQPIIYNGCQFRSGTFDNVAAGTQAAKWPRDGMPGHLPGHIARRS